MGAMQFSLVVSVLLLSLAASGSSYGDGIKPHGYGSTPTPELAKPYTTTFITNIQGMIYCKSGPKLFPIEGALARITCLAVDSYGYESAPFSFPSSPTNSKGYFFATVPQSSKKIKECKVFLKKSSLETCNVPSDVNKGISGAPLPSSYHFFQDKNIKLYSVGPFFYTPEHKAVIQIKSEVWLISEQFVFRFEGHAFVVPIWRFLIH